MSSFRLRPRFRYVTPGNQEKLEKELLVGFDQNEQFITTKLPGHIYVKIQSSDQHMWSPQLHMTFEQEEENVIVRGHYGPNPTLWAIFFFGYATLGLLACFLGMWGLSKWWLGMDATILWSLPVIGIIAIAMYLSAQAGQKLGAQQMFDIHHAFEKAFGEKVIIN